MMAHTISVPDEVYDKLVEKARRLDLPIGRAIDISGDGISVNEEKKEEQGNKNDKNSFVTQEQLDIVIGQYNSNFKKVYDELGEIKKQIIDIVNIEKKLSKGVPLLEKLVELNAQVQNLNERMKSLKIA